MVVAFCFSVQWTLWRAVHMVRTCCHVYGMFNCKTRRMGIKNSKVLGSNNIKQQETQARGRREREGRKDHAQNLFVAATNLPGAKNTVGYHRKG